MNLPSALLALLLAAPVCGVDADDRVDLTSPIERNLPPERNAYIIWREVVPKFHSPEDENVAKALHDFTRFTESIPLDEVRQKLAAWLDSMEPNLDRLYEGLALGACEFPESNLSVYAFSFPAFRRAWEAQLLRARFQSEKGLYAQAVETLAKGLRFADLNSSAGGDIIHWYIGVASRNHLQRGVRWIAMQDSASGAIPALLAALSGLFDDAAVRRSVAAEWTNYVLPDLNDVISGLATNQLFQGADGARLLNRAACTNLLVEMGEAVIENTRLTWAKQEPFLPDTIRTLCPMQDVDKIRDITRDASLNEKWFWNADTVTKVINLGQARENGVGLILVAIYAPERESTPRLYFSGRTETSLTRAYLLLRAHQLRAKEWPAQLSDALPANPPPDVVLDYFSNQPLRYSRERRLLWSVGPDGTDNDGDPAKDVVLDLANPVKISKPQP